VEIVLGRLAPRSSRGRHRAPALRSRARPATVQGQAGGRAWRPGGL